MLTENLQRKIDSIHQDYYNHNCGEIILSSITTLLFIKLLDERQKSYEVRCEKLRQKPKQELLTFKEGNYVNEELNINIPYSDLRWSNFKNLNPENLANRLKNYVIPFCKELEIARNWKDALEYKFDKKEKLLSIVVEKLSDDDFSFDESDALGSIYEEFIKTNLNGQYYTGRNITRLACELAKPVIGEQIIDPACGSGGFLLSAAQYIEKNQAQELHDKEKKKAYDEMFHGVDTDVSTATLANMNLSLHHIKNPRITSDHSYINESVADKEFEKYDLILANPPFSGSVDDSINPNLFSITKTKKTELLFVALFIKLLKVGGRCICVVPDGVLFGSSNAHKSLRKELVDGQKLVGVVSMPSGVFQPYSGVKTSLLIFEKTDGGGTDYVWFYDMKNDGYTLDVKRSPIEGSDIPDIISRFSHLSDEMTRTRLDQSFVVPVEEIRQKGYDLTLNKYKETKKEEKHYRLTSEIFNDIHNERKKVDEILLELEKKVGDGNE